MTKHHRTSHNSACRPATIRTRFSASPLPGAAAARRVLGLAAAVVALAFAPAAHAQTACDADINADGTVGASDLAALLGAWGACSGCAADVNNDGLVDAADLSALLGLWGGTCSQLPWATVLEFAPDPAVVTNGSLRKAIAATGLPWRVRDNGTQIEMLLVPPGTFNMGCSTSTSFSCVTDENPVHAVTLTNAYYIGRYEVTQAQWTARMGSNPSFFQSASAQVPAAQVPNRPVESVSWNTIQGFLSATGLRLPTEAEWEYAYRAGIPLDAWVAERDEPRHASRDHRVVQLERRKPDPPSWREGRERARAARHVWQRIGVGERLVPEHLLRVEPVDEPAGA
jgi:formylglycine-generating enzyme required for sulfatase activity